MAARRPSAAESLDDVDDAPPGDDAFLAGLDDFSDDWAWMAAETPAAPPKVVSSAGPRRRKRR